MQPTIDLFQFELRFLKFLKNLYNGLVTHITSNKILTNSQFGFRKNSSDKAAYKLIHNILTALNDNKLVGGIFFLVERKLLTV